jgi:hypothetical protein
MARVSGHIAQILRRNVPQTPETAGKKIVEMKLALARGRH